MNPSHANSRKSQRQVIDAEIKSLEESIRGLKHRRNALAPISSLPPEILAVIFSFFRFPGTSPLGKLPTGLTTDVSLAGRFSVSTDVDPEFHLAWLSVTHVCHHWREIVLNLPLFWSHVDFNTISLTGATEMLARAKTAPLYLKMKVPFDYWEDAWFDTIQKMVQAHVSHICHLTVGAEPDQIGATLAGLVLPAPTLEYLSLGSDEYGERTPDVFIPDTLFDGTAPRLSRLRLRNCSISWKSPLLKGLKHLQILRLSANVRPSLVTWLDALGEMPQLISLTLLSATPIAPPFSYVVERTVTLPSLTFLDITASAADCGLALFHLILPALTRLCLTVQSRLPTGGDVERILPHVARHAHGPQDTRPLQSMLIRGGEMRVDILVWTVPNIDLDDVTSLLGARHSARVSFSITSKDWFMTNTHIRIIDKTMTALPMSSLATLTAANRMQLGEQFWLSNALKWPLLQCVRLALPPAREFREMLLKDNGGRERPLLPSLTKLVLLHIPLSARRTLRLCDAFMKRVEQGVPLETLDLRTCNATGPAVRLFGEIVVDIWAPEIISKSRGEGSKDHGFFVEDYNSGAEDNSGDDDEDDSEIYYEDVGEGEDDISDDEEGDDEEIDEFWEID